MASCVSYTPTWPVRGRAGPGLAAEARSFSSYGHHLLWASKTQKRRELSADSRVPLGRYWPAPHAYHNCSESQGPPLLPPHCC